MVAITAARCLGVLLHFCFTVASVVGIAACRGDNDLLPLTDTVIFNSSCQLRRYVTLEGLELGNLTKNIENMVSIDANITYTCWDYSGNLISSISRNDFDLRRNDKAKTLVWFPSPRDNGDFYYGVSCKIFGCYLNYNDGNYYRFMSTNCSQYHNKDECLSPADNTCHDNATCHDLLNGTFTCSCNPPYVSNGTNCKDIDECSIDICDVNANCTNILGSFNCSCRTGYAGDGYTCEDIDECSIGTDNCDVNAKCTNIPGSFNCLCRTGYAGDGYTCEDVDECSIDICDVNANCTNIPGSFNCLCRTGYAGDGYTCDDTDECFTDICDVNANCTNTPGSFNCLCRTGYAGDGYTCEDVDECSIDICDVNANCTNIPGSFNCLCRTGYAGDGYTCDDIDECSIGTDNCDVNANCTNTPGSFNCLCRTGYTGDGYTCEDMICSQCSDLEYCENTINGYECVCREGYKREGEVCQGKEIQPLYLVFLLAGVLLLVAICVVLLSLTAMLMSRIYLRKKIWLEIHHGKFLPKTNDENNEQEIGNIFDPGNPIVEEDEISLPCDFSSIKMADSSSVIQISEEHVNRSSQEISSYTHLNKYSPEDSSNDICQTIEDSAYSLQDVTRDHINYEEAIIQGLVTCEQNVLQDHANCTEQYKYSSIDLVEVEDGVIEMEDVIVDNKIDLQSTQSNGQLHHLAHMVHNERLIFSEVDSLEYIRASAEDKVTYTDNNSVTGMDAVKTMNIEEEYEYPNHILDTKNDSTNDKNDQLYGNATSSLSSLYDSLSINLDEPEHNWLNSTSDYIHS